jgi:hypothetical protein
MVISNLKVVFGMILDACFFGSFPFGRMQLQIEAMQSSHAFIANEQVPLGRRGGGGIDSIRPPASGTDLDQGLSHFVVVFFRAFHFRISTAYLRMPCFSGMSF